MWHYNQTVVMTFVHHTTQWAWAYISSLGWQRVKDGAPDGCTNVFLMLSAAEANGRQVHVYVDGSNLITTAYLL
jgi:hypothetical protein